MGTGAPDPGANGESTVLSATAGVKAIIERGPGGGAMVYVALSNVAHLDCDGPFGKINGGLGDGAAQTKDDIACGMQGPLEDGWLAVAVRLHNVGESPIEGSLELVSELPWSSDRARNVTRAPFAVQGKSSVALELPTRGFNGAPPSLSLRALASDGTTLGEVDVLDPHPHGPHHPGHAATLRAGRTTQRPAH